MLAARIHAWNADPRVEEAPDPEPREGETLVALEAAAVAHIDLTVATGEFAFKPPLPYVPGTEGAGRVVRSDTFEAGTPVRIRGGEVGLSRDGTWASAVAVPDTAAYPLPAGADPALAATFYSPCVTAHIAVDEVGAVRSGERVGVRGAAGAVGAAVVQLARRAGAEVVGVDELNPERVAPDARGELEDLDVLVDTVGGPDLPAVIRGSVRPGGRAVLIGYTAGTTVSFELPAFLAADVRLLPVNLIRWTPRMNEVAARLLDDLRSGELSLSVTEFPLARVGDALACLRAGTAAGKVALTIEKGGANE